MDMQLLTSWLTCCWSVFEFCINLYLNMLYYHFVVAVVVVNLVVSCLSFFQINVNLNNAVDYLFAIVACRSVAIPAAAAVVGGVV